MANRYRPVLNLKTWSAGEIVTAGDLNQQGRNAINFLTHSRPAAQVENKTTSNSIPNNQWTDVKFDVIKRDNYSGFDSNGLYTCKLSGWYYVMAGVVFPNGGSGTRGLRLATNAWPNPNGAVFSLPDSGLACGVTFSKMQPLVEGQVLSVQAWQDSGGSLTLNNAGTEYSFLDLIFYSQFFGYSI